MDIAKIVKQIYQGRLNESRTVGRPKKVWLDEVDGGIKKKIHPEFEESEVYDVDDDEAKKKGK